MRRIFIVLAIIGLAMGCQDDDETAAAGAPVPGTIDGLWAGIQSVAGTEGVETQTKKVEFNFLADHKFQMKMTDDAQEASGLFTDFQRTKNLFLEITESTIPSLGLKGAARDFVYDLVDNELILKADKTTYKLMRTQAETPKETKPLFGKWNGKDSNGNNWLLTVDETGFSLTVTSADRTRPLMMGGPVSYLELSQAETDIRAKALLTVTRAVPVKQLDYILAILREDVLIYKTDASGKIIDETPTARLIAQPK